LALLEGKLLDELCGTIPRESSRNNYVIWAFTKQCALSAQRPSMQS